MIGIYFGGSAYKTLFSSDRIGNIELDANLDENHEWSAEATSNPVENGAPITDHVIEHSDKLKIKGFVSVSIVASPSVTSTFTDDNRTQAVFNLLRDLIKAKELVTVYTKYRIYDNMILTNLTIPRTPDNGESIEFSADFIHIRKVATQIVDIRTKPAGGKNGSLAKKTTPTKVSGQKQARDVDASFAKTSAFKHILSGVTLF